MSEKPISPLRQRMIEDMTVRNFVEKTRNDYIRQVKTFTAFLGRSPDQAIPESWVAISAAEHREYPGPGTRVPWCRCIGRRSWSVDAPTCGDR